MQIARLRNKLLLSVAAICALMAIAAMLATSLVISHQFLEESNTLLKNASDVINDRLEKRKEHVLLTSHQLAIQNNLGSTIWYLAKYGQSKVNREMLAETYLHLAKDIHKIARVANLSSLSAYDSNGHLMVYTLIGKQSDQVGFVKDVATGQFFAANLQANDEIQRDALLTLTIPLQFVRKFSDQLPQAESTHYAVDDGILVIESYAPIMGEIFNPKNGKQETRQLGLIVATQMLNQSFVDELSKSTSTSINVFSTSGFSRGKLPAYHAPDWSGLHPDAISAAETFNEIKLEGKAYYQMLMPLYNDGRSVGAIAALTSKELVEKNAFELITTLGVIMAASLLLALPFVIYFANTISHPLTMLSNIFKRVAESNQELVLRSELQTLHKERDRLDELGVLTQSFIAMNDSVNQKIREIHEINATLENKVRERTSALIAKEQESRTMVENSPDTIARYDSECRRIYVNRAFGNLASGGINALLGKSPTQHPSGPNSAIYETKIKEVFASGQDANFELYWNGKEGRQICSHIRLTPEFDAAGNVETVLGVGRDITELNDSRNALNESMRQLESKELAKTRFLAAAGHDLRQPLAAANLFIDALKYSDLSQEQRHILQRLEQSMDTFKGLLDALLNISKLDAGIIEPDHSQIDIAQIMGWLEQSYVPLATEKHLAFKLHFPLNEALYVYSDLGLIKSVLMNLVSNAIKFTTRGGVMISARKRGDRVFFQVWDTGLGIASEEIDKIFDEFYQTNNPQRDRNRGLGLGLAIVKRALNLLGEEISCRSALGHGSVFGFYLPMDATAHPSNHSVSADEMIATDVENEDIVSRFVRDKYFILLEDDQMVASAMTDLLCRLGARVDCFASAEQALSHADIDKADYYIADYMLDGSLNGIQFLTRLQQIHDGKITAVLVTGDTSTTTLRHTGDAPWPVLHKPVNMNQLIKSLLAKSF